MKIPTLVLALVLLAGSAHAQTKPASPDEFVPVNAPTNAQESIPAPRLVGIAYGFIWVVLLGYVWSVRSRLATIEREMQTVSKRVEAGRR